VKTTLRLEVATRDLVKQVGSERGLDDDATIRLGMSALRREQMRRESLAAAADHADRDEAKRVTADMQSWGCAVTWSSSLH